MRFYSRMYENVTKCDGMRSLHSLNLNHQMQCQQGAVRLNEYEKYDTSTIVHFISCKENIHILCLPRKLALFALRGNFEKICWRQWMLLHSKIKRRSMLRFKSFHYKGDFFLITVPYFCKMSHWIEDSLLITMFEIIFIGVCKQKMCMCPGGWSLKIFIFY